MGSGSWGVWGGLLNKMNRTKNAVGASGSGAQHMPWWMLTLLATALAAWGLGAIYTLRWNPEIKFFRRADELKRAWEANLRVRSAAPCAVVCGGSSVTTSVDPRSIEERQGLRVINAGLGAGMGARVLTAYGLEHAAPGDLLLVSLEPDLLGGEIVIEPLGTQFAIAVGRPGLLRIARGVDWSEAVAGLRPGGYHAVTLFWKWVLRQPWYRYDLAELHAGGWHAVAARRDVHGPGTVAPRLSPAGRELLAGVVAAMAARGGRAVYAVPRGYCPPDRLPEYRRWLAAFAAQVAAAMPVLRDPGFGAVTDPALFADTPWHPTPESAVSGSAQLGARLTTLETWSKAELEALAAGR